MISKKLQKYTSTAWVLQYADLRFIGGRSTVALQMSFKKT